MSRIIFYFYKIVHYRNSHLFGLNPQLNYYFTEGEGLCFVILIQLLHMVHPQGFFGNLYFKNHGILYFSRMTS